MPMKSLPHPGRSIRENCLDPLGLSVTEAAGVLVVARHTLSRVLNGYAAVSPDMAIRLEKAGWSSADFWLNRRQHTTWPRRASVKTELESSDTSQRPLRRDRPRCQAVAKEVDSSCNLFRHPRRRVGACRDVLSWEGLLRLGRFTVSG